MKKKVWGVLIVVGILSVGIGLYYYSTLKKSMIEHLLPEGALLYGQVDEGMKLLEGFKLSQLGQAVLGIDVSLLLEKSGQPKRNIELFNRLKKDLSSPAALLLLKKFFGREVAVALYPAETVSSESKVVDKILANVFLVTRLEPEAQLLELLSVLFKDRQSALSVETKAYLGKTITNIDLSQLGYDGLVISYVKEREHVVIGFSENAARACIEVLSQQRRPLSSDPDYLKAKGKFLPLAQGVGYLNWRLFLKSVQGEITKMIQLSSEEETRFEKQMEEVLSSMAGFESLGYSCVFGKMTTIRSDLIFDKDKFNPQMRKMYSCPAQKNESFKIIPQGVLLYQWGGCYDFPMLWEKFKKDLEKDSEFMREGNSVSQTIANWEEALQLTVEGDILAALGKEVGWFLADIDLRGVFPLPSGVVFVKIDNMAKAEKVIEKLSEQKFILLQTEQYKGALIKYFSLPLGINAQPGYCFLDDYLLITTHRQLLKNSIDAFYDPAVSLLNQPDGKEVLSRINAESNGVLFLAVRKMVRKVDEIIRWGSDWVLARHKQRQAYKEGSKKRLLALRTEAENLRTELNDSEQKWQDLIAQQQVLVAGGQVLEDIAAKIEKKKADIDDRKQAVGLAQERIQEQQEIVEGFEREKDVDAELIELYLEEAVGPFLKGLESLTVLGAQTNLGEDDLFTTIYIKTE
ncbi:MAG: DUF3352 domain-containing protein [Candidatus Omnitrophota bacterium]